MTIDRVVKLPDAIEYGSAGWWLQQIRFGEKARQRFAFEDRWNDIDAYYTHHAYKPQDAALNLIYMFGRALIPGLIFQNPSIIHTPTNPAMIPFASIQDSISNWLVREMELKDVVSDAILHGYLHNMGAIHTAYDFSKKLDIGGGSLRKQLRLLEKDALKTPFKDRARRKDFPWLESIDPRNIVFHPAVKRLRVCPWFAKRCIYPTKTLRDHADVWGLIEDNIKPTHVLNEGMQDNADVMFGDQEYTTFYQMHNAEDGTWFWITSSGDYLFEAEDDPLQVDGLPIDTIVFNRHPNSIWGTPDALFIENQMLDGNDSRQAGLEQRRFATLKGLVDQNILDKADIEKFYSNPVPLIPVKSLPAGKSLQECVAFFNPPVQMQLLEYQKAIMNDAQLILGFGPNQLGTFAPGRRSKYEAQLVEARNDERLNERRHQVAEVITSIMRKVEQLIYLHWNEEKVYQVVGVDGAMYWVQARPSDIKAEMELKVDVESLVPPSNSMLKEELANITGMLSKIPNINLIPVVKEFLAKFPNINVNDVRYL